MPNNVDGSTPLNSESDREDHSASISLWLVKGDRVERAGSSAGRTYICPVWSADGKWIYFGRDKDVWRQLPKADAEPEQVLPEGQDNIVVSSFSPDGNYALGVAFNPALKRSFDIYRLNLKERTRQWWSATGAGETQPAISPDGEWVAWLCEYPRPGRLCISPSQNPKSVGYLSTMPTIEPLWSRDGKQLYFLDEGGWLRSVHLKFSSGLPAAETTDRLFRLNGTTRSGASYAVTPDPGKFLVREPYQAPADPVLVWNPH